MITCYDILYSCLHISDNWIKCDDEKLSIVKDEDVLKLSGGGEMTVAHVFNTYFKSSLVLPILFCAV